MMGSNTKHKFIAALKRIIGMQDEPKRVCGMQDLVVKKDYPKDRESEQIKIPGWYKEAWKPDRKEIEWWEYQAHLQNAGKDFKEPEETFRHNKMHQQFSLSFYEEIPKEFTTILDVGCNDGWMCKVFKDNSKKPIGINDFLYPTDYKFMIDNDLDIRIMDMHALDFQSETFDAIWLRHSLEHSIAPLIALSECHRVLKTGGYIFIALPPVPDPPERYPGHYNLIPDYQLQYFLEIHRFDILKLYIRWLSFERENDNLEIRCIAKKTNKIPGELHRQKSCCP